MIQAPPTRLFPLGLLLLALTLAACGNHPESGRQADEAPPHDTLPAYRTALEYFEAGRAAFDRQDYRQTTDFLVAGMRGLHDRAGELPDSMQTRQREALQQLDRMASRLSRYELESGKSDLSRDFARAELEMAHALIIPTLAGQAAAADSPAKVILFSIDALRRAAPFLPGHINDEAAALNQRAEGVLRQYEQNPGAENIRAQMTTLLINLGNVIGEGKTTIQIE